MGCKIESRRGIGGSEKIVCSLGTSFSDQKICAYFPPENYDEIATKGFRKSTHLANPTIASYNSSAVKITTPRVALCVFTTKIFLSTLKNAIAYYIQRWR
jgi:hypothetical protein